MPSHVLGSLDVICSLSGSIYSLFGLIYLESSQPRKSPWLGEGGPLEFSLCSYAGPSGDSWGTQVSVSHVPNELIFMASLDTKEQELWLLAPEVRFCKNALTRNLNELSAHK